MAIVFVGCTPGQFEWPGNPPADQLVSTAYRRPQSPTAISMDTTPFKVPQRYVPDTGAIQLLIAVASASGVQPTSHGLFRIGNFCIDRVSLNTNSPVRVFALNDAGAKAGELGDVATVDSLSPSFAMFTASYSPTSLQLFLNGALMCDVSTEDHGNRSFQLGGSRISTTQYCSEVIVDDDPSKTKQRYVSFFRPSAADAGATLTGDVDSLNSNNVLKGIGGDAAEQFMELTSSVSNAAGIPGSFSKKTTTLHYSVDAPNLDVEFASRASSTSDPLQVLHTRPADPMPSVREQLVIPNYDSANGLPSRVRMTLR